MEIKGKCVAVLPLQTGQGKNGEWKSQDFVIETGDQYPKKVCVNAFGDKIQYIPEIGQEVNVSFDVESREYNGRWYTTVMAWKIEKAGAGQSPSSNSVAPPVSDIVESTGSNVPF